MPGLSAGVAYLDVLPKVGSGFAGQLSHDLSAPIAAEGKKISAALSQSMTIGKVAAVAGFAAIAGAAFKGMSAAVSATEEFGHSVLVLQRQLGGTAEDASKLVVLGQHVGISVDTMSRAFGLFSKNLSNNSAQVQRYGLSLRDASGEVKPFNQLLGEASDVYVGLGSAIEKTAFAQNVFGRGGKEIIPILKLGSEAIAEISAEAKKYGLILTQGNVEAIHEFALAQNDASLASQGLKVSIGTQLIPILTTFERVLTAGLEVLNRIPGPIKAVALVTVGLVAGLTALGIVVGIVRGALGNLGIGLTQTVVEEGAVAVSATAATVALEGQAAAAVGAGTASVAAGAGAAAGAAGMARFAGIVVPFNPVLKVHGDIVKEVGGKYVKVGSILADGTVKMNSHTTAVSAAVAAEAALATKLRDSTTAFYANTTAALANRNTLLGLQGGLLGVIDSSRSFADANRAVGAAQRQVDEDIAKGRRGTQQFRDDVLALSDAQYAAVRANFSLKQSIASYADQLLGPVKTAQDAVAASLANKIKVEGDAKASAQDLQDATDGVTAAQDDLAAAEKGLAPEQQKAIAQLDAMARKAGFSKAEIADLNDKIFGYIGRVKGIPKAATTKVTAPGLDNVLSMFQSLYGVMYRIKSLGGIQIPVGGGAGRGSKGGLFAGYAGGAFFESPGGHFFQAGEGTYPTPLGKGGEIVNEKGVMPLDARGRRAIAEASGVSGIDPDALALAIGAVIWPMIRAVMQRPVSVQVNRREIALAVSDQGLAER